VNLSCWVRVTRRCVDHSTMGCLRLIAKLCDLQNRVQRHRFVPLAITTTCVGMDVIVYGMITPLLPDYMAYFHIGAIQVGLLVAAYAMGAFPLQPAIGWFSDRYNTSKLPIACGLLLLSVASLVYSLASVYWLLVFARVLQGISSAFTWTCSMSSLSRYYPSNSAQNDIDDDDDDDDDDEEEVVNNNNNTDQPTRAARQEQETAGTANSSARRHTTQSNTYTSIPQIVSETASSSSSSSSSSTSPSSPLSSSLVQKHGGAMHSSPMLGFALGVANAGSAVGGFIGAPLGGILYQASDSFFVPFFVVTIAALLVFTLAVFAFPNSSTFDKEEEGEIGLLEVLADPEGSEERARLLEVERERVRRRTMWKSTTDEAVLHRMVEKHISRRSEEELVNAAHLQQLATEQQEAFASASLRQNAVLFVVVFLCQVVAALQMEFQGIVLSLYIESRFGASAGELGIIFGLLAVATAVAAVLGGMLADRLQMRWLLVAGGFASYTLVSLSTAFPTSFWLMGIVIVLLGLSFGVITVAMSLLEEVASTTGQENKMAWFFGVGFSMYTLGMIIGPLLAGWLPTIFDIETELFYIQLVPAMIALIFLGVLVMLYPALLRRAQRLAKSERERSLLAPFQADLDLLERPINDESVYRARRMQKLEEEEEEEENDDEDEERDPLLLSEHLFPDTSHRLSPSASASISWEENTAFGERSNV